MGTSTAAVRFAFLVATGLGTADLCLINFVIAPELTQPSSERSSSSTKTSPLSSPSAALSAATSAAHPTSSPPSSLETAALPSGSAPSSTAPTEPPASTAQPQLDRLPPPRVIYFPTKDVDLDTAADATLAAVVEVLRANPRVRLLLRGHSDERGTTSSNDVLSEARARSVSLHLVEAGIAAERIRIEAVGARRPVKTGHTAADWASNRRVEILWSLAEK